MHANDLSMHRSPDSEILQSAARDDRVIITADLDFPRLLAPLGSTGPGLILLRGGNYSEAESRECGRRVLMAILPDAIFPPVHEPTHFRVPPDHRQEEPAVVSA
ncbi:MAG: DUF5615 family PIN-like protein [Acidobacteriia bacterium]|nr:DUF5615 family PIN-like protein [Terriglobia bacterium]